MKIIYYQNWSEKYNEFEYVIHMPNKPLQHNEHWPFAVRSIYWIIPGAGKIFPNIFPLLLNCLVMHSSISPTHIGMTYIMWCIWMLYYLLFPLRCFFSGRPDTVIDPETAVDPVMSRTHFHLQSNQASKTPLIISISPISCPYFHALDYGTIVVR
jgi:hypothetical protein